MGISTSSDNNNTNLAKITDYKELYFEDERKLKELQTNYNSIKNQLTTCQTATTDSNKVNLDSMNIQITSLENKIKVYQKNESKLKDQIKLLSVNNDCINNKNKLENEYIALQKEYTQCKDHGCDAYKDEIANLNIEVSKLNIKLNDEISGKANNNTRLTDQLEINKTLIKERDKLVQKVNNLENEAKLKVNTYNQMKTDYEAIKAQLDEKDDLVNSIQTKWHTRLDPVIGNFETYANIQNKLQIWLEKLFDVINEYTKFNEYTKGLSQEERNAKFKSMITSSQETIRNMIDDMEKEGKTASFISAVDSNDGKLIQSFNELLGKMKLKSSFDISQVLTAKTIIKAMRENLKGKISKAAGEIKTIDVTKEAYDSFYVNSHKLTTEDIITIILIVAIVVLVYIFRYEFWAVITGKERFVNMFGGHDEISYKW